ncbi:UDP-2-acetamido-3-amino-2,3-dideoxy-glucuronate N-acetyltransferase [Aquamicrobium lusatiense]|uniref:UDP-2-acetamido-3-amino-2,3-dideoxy-glucuronate N-acetyltransferase n=1 Tax=Aquamicrobium lusatiense TaxID=89772 RepID=A0A7W9VVI5_9HYPH|nr:Gfo/Idh/MocA family oxidoreductase [Aquamicrobium lusatiense]MBB6012240.1 UDP-2-acetamido-3-amino-2,3-dideoxy-glucuronate N-acetyltransferase [Aquamicrobium lusatiense]
MTSIAHVGHGYWGRNLARNFHELGHLAVVVDPDPKAAEAAAASYGVRAATFEEVLSDAGVDGVSIASPAGLHYRQAKAALEAGKHVYVEKPLALDVAEAAELCALAEARGLTLMVGHLLQYHPVYLKLRAMVEAGELGRLLHVYSNRLSLGKFRTEENVLWSFAPHDISMILGLVGEEPVTVSAQGNVAFTPGVADLVSVQMRFPGGAAAHVLASWMHPFKEQRLVVIGDKGMAVFEDSQPDWDDKLIIYRHIVDVAGPVPAPAKADGERVAVEKQEPLKQECRHFIQSIKAGTAPRTDGREGLAVLRVLDRAEKSLATNLIESAPLGENA